MPVIGHINLARGFRGGERQTQLLIRELSEQGFPQVLLAHRGGELVQRLDAVPGLALRPVSGNLAAVALAAGGTDLLHVHEGRGVYCAWLRNLFAGTPYVVTRRVNNTLGNSFITHSAYRRAACVVGVARDLTRILEAYDPRIRHQVIHSATSMLAANATEAARLRAMHPGKFIVGHVGALDNAQKGHEYIIAAARDLERSDPQVHFVLVGGGPDEAMIRELAHGLGNVTFAGFVNNVGDYMASFDMFILPSNREGIGAVLLDAMSAGLPVVASRVAGLPEIVHDGKNGLLIEPREPGQLRDAIRRLYADPALRRALGGEGRQFAAGFTPASMARQYVALYQSILRQVHP